MTDAHWRPIERTKIEALGGGDGNYHFVLHLSAVPDRDWVALYLQPAHISGTSVQVDSPRRPSGARIEFTARDLAADLDGWVQHLDARITAANQSYPVVLAERQRLADEETLRAERAQQQLREAEAAAERFNRDN